MKNILLFLFILLQFADAYTTLEILKRGGRERNAILNRIAEFIGMKKTLILKTILAIGLFGILYWYGNLWILSILCIFYLIVVLNNSYILRKKL